MCSRIRSRRQCTVCVDVSLSFVSKAALWQHFPAVRWPARWRWSFGSASWNKQRGISESFGRTTRRTYARRSSTGGTTGTPTKTPACLGAYCITLTSTPWNRFKRKLENDELSDGCSFSGKSQDLKTGVQLRRKGHQPQTCHHTHHAAPVLRPRRRHLRPQQHLHCMLIDTC